MAKKLNKGTATGGRQNVAPDFAVKDTGGYPHIEQTPQFVLIYNPKRWTIMDGRLVPQLHHFPLEAGVNGVEFTKDGSIRFSRAKAQKEEQDRKVIPHGWGPNGEPYQSAVETRPPGTKEVVVSYIPVWAEAHEGSTDLYTDTSAYADWLESLVTEGKVSPCPIYLAKKLLEGRVKSLREAEIGAQKGQVAASLRAEALQTDVQVLQTYVGDTKGKKVTTKKTAPKLEDE